MFEINKLINSDVSQVNILRAHWAVAHCYIYVSSAVTALGLILDWLLTSIRTKHVGKILIKIDNDVAKIKQ